MPMLCGGSTPVLQWLMQFAPPTHCLDLSTSILFYAAGPGGLWPELAALTALRRRPVR